MYRLQSNQHVIYTGEAGMKAIRKAMEGHGKKKDKPQDEGLLKFAIQTAITEGMVIEIVLNTFGGTSDIEILINKKTREYPSPLEKILFEEVAKKIIDEASYNYIHKYNTPRSNKTFHKSVTILKRSRLTMYTEVQVDLYQIGSVGEELLVHKYQLTTKQLFNYEQRKNSIKS